MQISSAFPSNYLKAADLQDRNVRVVMAEVKMEDIGDDRKPVLYFQGKDKGLVLNKTNANNISVVYGDDTDGWAGREVVLFPTLVDYQGRSVPAIRIRAPQPKDNITTSPQRMAEAPKPRVQIDPDDEIPF